MRTLAALITIFSLIGLADNAQAQNLLAYWNMDADWVQAENENSIPPQPKFEANDGSQRATVTMTAASNYFIYNSLGNGAGTEDNIYPEGAVTAVNNSLSINEYANVQESAYLTISDLDLSAYTETTVSFAAISSGLISWGDHITFQYRTNNGSWNTLGRTGNLPSSWAVESIALPIGVSSEENPLNDVDIRFNFIGFVDVGASLRIDNIQINAVPEPATYALMAGLAVMGVVALRRRLRQQA